MCEHIRKDSLFSDLFFFPETNNWQNWQDGTFEPTFDYQYEIDQAIENYSVIWIQAARGASKSSRTARATTKYLLRNGNQACKIVGPSFRQSKESYKYCLKYIRQNSYTENLLYKMEQDIPRDAQREGHDQMFEIMNGSSCQALPAGDGCLAADAMVTYGDHFGYVNGIFLPDTNVKASAKRKESVWSEGQFEKTDVAFSNGVKPTLKITTNKGYEITGTPNHQIQVVSGTECIFKRFDEIVPGDIVPIDRSKRWHSGSILATEDECYALGLLVGDGCWTNPNKVGFATKDVELAEHLKVLLPNISRQSDGVHWNANGTEQNLSLVERFGLIGKYAHEKAIPKALMGASKPQMAAFIAGLMDSDGHVSNPETVGKQGRKQLRASFCNTSKTLIEQLRYILLHFGISTFTRVRTHAKQSWRQSYELWIVGRSLGEFYREIPLRLERKKARLQRMMDLKQRWPIGRRNVPNALYQDTDRLFESIVSVEDAGMRPTFDMQVPRTSHYQVQGFFGHNSTLRGQRATILWLEEFYKADRTLTTSHVKPFLNVKRGDKDNKLIYVTTSWFQDVFAYSVLMEVAKYIKAGSKRHYIVDITIDDVVNSERLYLSDEPEGTLNHRGEPLLKHFPADLGTVYEQLQSGTDNVTGNLSDDVRMTFYNEWIKSSANFFRTDKVYESQRDDVPLLEKRPEKFAYPIVMGIDPAGNGADATEMAILSLPGNEHRHLNAVWKWEKQRPEEIAGHIHKMVDLYGMKLMVMDKTGALGHQIADLCTRKVQLIDGVWQERVPITPHDHPDALFARAHIVLTLPSDEKMVSGLYGPRVDSTITGEIELKNAMLLDMKARFENSSISCAMRAKDTDYVSADEQISKGELLDNIREALAQFPRIDILKEKDGKTPRQDGRGNWYFKRPAKDDGAFAVTYGNWCANVLYKQIGRKPKPEEIPVMWDTQTEAAQEAWPTNTVRPIF